MCVCVFLPMLINRAPTANLTTLIDNLHTHAQAQAYLIALATAVLARLGNGRHRAAGRDDVQPIEVFNQLGLIIAPLVADAVGRC